MSATTLYENVTARILAEMEKGALPWVKPWREIPGGHIPANLATGNRYSGCNVFLLWITAQTRGWDDLRFCTYKQAESIGAHVKEGERSTQIYFMQPREIGERDAEGNAVLKKIFIMRQYNVFNIAQLGDVPEKFATVPDAPQPAPDSSRLAHCDLFMTASGARITEAAQDRAFYRSATDEIFLPLLSQFASVDSFYATAFHELGHWTGHESRLVS